MKPDKLIPVYTYEIENKLNANVNDFDKANNYLLEANYMTGILKAHMLNNYDKKIQKTTKELEPHIIDIKWSLKDEQTLNISLLVNKKLNNIELKELNENTIGQASDGLGEGFEQQDFADYLDKEEYDIEYNY